MNVAENVKIYGREMRVEKSEDKSQLNFQCEIEANGSEIRRFEKNVILSTVTPPSNLLQPQETEDLHFYLDEQMNDQISLSLYYLETQSWKSKFEVGRKQ